MKGKAWWMAALAACMVAGMALEATAESPEATVKKVYREMLGRDPDTSGMSTFRSRIIDDGWSEEDVRNEIRKSDEFKTHRARIWVRRAYEDLLGRKPSVRERDQWVKRVLEENWDEKKLRELIRKSPEAKKR